MRNGEFNEGEIGNAEVGMRNFKAKGKAHRAERKETNSELGMRPPAHRGIRLRPGGNAENRKRRTAQGTGQSTAVDGTGCKGAQEAHHKFVNRRIIPR